MTESTPTKEEAIVFVYLIEQSQQNAIKLQNSPPLDDEWRRYFRSDHH